MRLLLLLLTGCRAGDHDLLIDRAYWARRLPLTLADNGSANEFGRCGRGNGFDAASATRRHWIQPYGRGARDGISSVDAGRVAALGGHLPYTIAL